MRPWLALPLALLIRPLPDAVPPTLGMWYWHTPFRVNPVERTQLVRMGVKTLYVRAGTFSSDGKRAVTILPQTWETPLREVDVVLTMNFDPGLISHIESMSVETLATEVAQGLRDARKKAAGNIRFGGYQLDVDCPTRLLPRYADLLRRVRKRLGGGLSITALPTWLKSRDVRSLADAVDFIVPQFYENRTGRTLATLEPVSDADALRNGLRQLRDLGLPFRAGLSAYGHALLYDSQGKLVAMYNGLSPEDALRHPALMPESEGDLEGERKLVMRATAPDANGRGMGTRIAYVLPTAEALRRQIKAYRATAPANELGPILYRFPEPGEAMALSLATQEAALRGRLALPTLQVALSSKAAPWNLISPETGASRPSQILRLRATVVGDGPSEAARNAVQLLVRLDRPGIDGVAPGDFDAAEFGTLDERGTFSRCSGVRADTVLFRRGHVLPGDDLRTGAVEVAADGATTAQAEWAVRGPDGNVRGESRKFALDPAER